MFTRNESVQNSYEQNIGCNLYIIFATFVREPHNIIPYETVHQTRLPDGGLIAGEVLLQIVLLPFQGLTGLPLIRLAKAELVIIHPVKKLFIYNINIKK